MRVIVEDTPPPPAAVAIAVAETACGHGGKQGACESCSAEETAARPIINGPADVHKLLAPLFVNEPQEHYLLVALDVHRRLLKDGVVVVAKGQRTAVSVAIEDIVREMSVRNADSFISVHNHPSNSAKPSEADRDLWKKIDRAFDPRVTGIDIVAVDHLVFTDKSYYSCAEKKQHRV